jgi:hypothetical protein
MYDAGWLSTQLTRRDPDPIHTALLTREHPNMVKLPPVHSGVGMCHGTASPVCTFHSKA